MPTKLEQDRTERAEAAVKAFRALQPGLSGFARGITGKKNVRVEIATGGPRTDGTTIFFRPPIELGDKTPHDRMLCDKRDRKTGMLKCKACAIREKVLASILHEISHIAFGTFEKPSEKTLNEAMDRALGEVSNKFAKIVRDNWGKIPAEQKQDHINLSKFISPFLPLMLNCLEDVRVESAMFKARPGTRVMFDSLAKEAFQNGVTLDDGTVSMWRDQPLNSQALIGLYVLGCGFDYKGWFHEDVEAALGDARLRELVGKVDTLRSAEGTYNLAFPILARLRELGFLRTPQDPDDEQEAPEEPEPEEETDDAGDGEDADEAEDQGGDDEGSPSPDGSDDRDADPETTDSGDDGEADGDAGAPEDDEAGAGGNAPDMVGDGGDESPEEGEPAPGPTDGDDAEGSGDPADLDEGSDADGDGPGQAEQAGPPGESDSDGNDSDGVGSAEGDERGDDDGGSGDVREGAADEGSSAEGAADGTADGEPDSGGDAGEAQADVAPAGDDSSAGDDSAAGGGDQGSDSGGEGSPNSDASSGDGAQSEGSQAGADGSPVQGEESDAASVQRPEALGDDAESSGGQPDSDEPTDSGEALGDDAGAGSGVVPTPDPAGDEGPADREGDGDAERLRADGVEDESDEGLRDGLGDAADKAEDNPRGNADRPDGEREAAEEASDQGHPSGVEDDDEEIIDTLPDEGKGGEKSLRNDLGEPEKVRGDLLLFGRHDAIHDPEPPSPQEEADMAEVDRAIVQGLYFETPSMHVSGVRIHKFGDDSDVHADAWPAEDDEWIRRNAKRLGLDRSLEVGEDILGPALIQMRKTFADNKRAAMQRHLKSGKVNARSLGKRAWAGDPRLFQKKRIPGKRDYAVLIGIDISGSTAGMNLMLAKRAARTQAELCHRMGIDFAVYAHSANGWWEEFTMDIYEVKAFDKAWDEMAQRALANLTDDAGNLDGHTIEFYRKVLEKHPATDKILLYYTDGKMPAANHDEELEILLREIAYCRNHQISLLGVGIRTDSPRQYGLDTVQVDDDSDMVKVVRHLETALLRRR